MTLAEKLKKVRELNHTSMNKMAKALDTSPPTYKQWELGIRPTRKAINRLAQLTGVPAEIWLNDEHELPPLINLNLPNTHTPSGAKSDPDEPYQLRWRQFLMMLVGNYDSQSELADLIGIDNPTLSRLLTGKKPLTRRMMFKVGRATGNYGWYEAPQPPDHEGYRLRDYLDFHGIEQQELAERMGYVKSAIHSLLGREIIKKTKWQEITTELNTTREVVMLGITPISTKTDEEDNNLAVRPKQENISEKDTRIVYINDRLKQIDELYSSYVSLRTIPGDARTGFNYSSMVVLLKESLTPLHQLKRANNPVLSASQQLDERLRYDILIIGSNDYMEPGLRAGQEVLIYRLHEDQAVLDYTASRWSDEQGPMVVQTRSGQLRVGRVMENTLTASGQLTFVTDDPRGGSFTLNREQIAHLWKLESYVGGPVV